MKVSQQFDMAKREDPSSSGSNPSKLPFLMRTRAMGSSGWEAYTIGFTLVGCIVAGAGAGFLLDAHFKTTFWLPVLFLVGVAGGFREMLVVLKRLGAQQEQERRERQAQTPLAPPPASTEAQGAPELPVERKRVFEVPPPPLDGQTQAQATPPAEESVDDILKRLMDEGDLDEGKTNEKR